MVGPPPDISVAPGDQVDIPIEVDMSAAAGVSIASLQFEVSWDPGLLTYVSTTPGAPADWSVFLNETQTGSGVLGVGMFSPGGTPNSFTAVTLKLQAATVPEPTTTLIDVAVTAAGDAVGIDLLPIIVQRDLLLCIGVTGILGDVNMDGVVNIIDAQQVARHSVGLPTPNAPKMEEAGDVNEDGVINIIDAQQIARFSVGLPTPKAPNIGEPLPGCPVPGDIAIYKNYDAWAGSNKDEATLQGPPFNFTPGVDYFVRTMGELITGIPNTTSLIIITSASDGDAANQITDQNDPSAVTNLEAWVTNGGWLVVHAGDNGAGIGYIVPGLSGIADDVEGCTGLTLVVQDHALIRGPDAALGTADDLDDENIDNGGRFCSDNHGALSGILPVDAEVLMIEQGDGQRPVYATYTLGTGRVIVTTLTLEFAAHSTQTLLNHFYWAINGLNAPPAGAAPVVANQVTDAGTRSSTDTGRN